jgi:hypothetical protein
MEKANEGTQLGLVHRAVALGLAVATTGFIAASTAVVFTGSTQAVGLTVAQAAIAPIRALLGG